MVQEDSQRKGSVKWLDVSKNDIKNLNLTTQRARRMNKRREIRGMKLCRAYGKDNAQFV